MRRDSLYLTTPVVLAVTFWALCAFCIAAAAAPKLSEETAKKLISQLVDFKLLPEAIEIRRMTTPRDSETIAETTVTLAFQFEKNKEGLWTVDFVRLGDLDWLDMSELLAAIYHGNPPPSRTPVNAVPARTLTPADKFHTNPSDFEKQRRAMVELGASPLIPDSIEIRRVINQSGTRAIVESTVSMGFRFQREGKNWKVQAARLGNYDWVDIHEVLATLNEGRRRDTVSRLERLAAAIDAYRAKNNGTLPAARDIVELNDLLHPAYISELVRVDAWNEPVEYTVSGSTFRLASRGADGLRGTADDIVVQR